MRSFPLSVASFYDALRVRQATPFDMGGGMARSGRTAGVEVLTARIGNGLIEGEVSLAKYPHKMARAILTDLRAIKEGGGFMIYDKSNAFPASDPDGSILGAATPSLSALNANRKDGTISGLPADYVLTKGDAFAFSYASGPTRFAYHWIEVGGTATGAGQVPVEIWPPIRTGYTLPVTVEFKKAPMKAKILEIRRGSAQGVFTDGMGFKWSQTLR